MSYLPDCYSICEGVYAIADIAKQPAFAHVSWEDYRRLKAILCGENRTCSDRVLGYTVYIEPQVGRVGMTNLGFYRMIINTDTDKILGATLVGYETADLVYVFLDLIEAGATWQLLE